MFNKDITPPQAKKKPKQITIHGDTRIDDYFWLSDKDNDEVIKHIEAENEYTEQMMKDTKELQDKIYKEFLSRIKETDQDVPVKIDKWFYYSRTEEGKQYPIHCRKKGKLDADEEVILDENELAEGHEFFSLGVFDVSPNHRYLAYSVDTNGSEEYTIWIKDLQTGELLADTIPNTQYGFEWNNDNASFFYVTLNKEKQPDKIWLHQLGEDIKGDKLYYHEKDMSYFLHLYKTKDKKYIIIYLGGHTTSECHYISADKPDGDFIVIQPRVHDLEYHVESYQGEFLILTNHLAKNFRIVKTPIDKPTKENWQDYIPHRESVYLEDMEVFKEHIAVFERDRGIQKIYIINTKNGEKHHVDFQEPVYSISSDDNPDFNSHRLRFDYSSMITPNSVYDYNMDTKQRELKKQDEVLGGYDPSMYQQERIYAKAKDGKLIPISLVYKKGFKKNGSHPGYLYGYGSYGVNIPPGFGSTIFTYLDRGFVFGIAHIRGSKQMGQDWYEDGKFLNKINTFTDFIACIEHLIDNGYTSPDRLAIEGRSAGGLLMGAVTNMRPDLFKVVVAGVPFVDVLNTMLDDTLPLTIPEYEEWGNPKDKEYYDYMKAYSPYDNVKEQDYPYMIVTSGLNDPRVTYWEPTKWVLKLRGANTSDSIILLKTNMGAGHRGQSGRYSRLKEHAFFVAFVLKVLGIEF
jgi:oligopeptidase B